MMLPDVGVLVYAHREDSPHHCGCLAWLESVVNGDEAYGLSELVLSGFVRVVTHARVFARPSPLADALAFAQHLRACPDCVPAAPGRRHWGIFCGPCDEAGAKGHIVPDAYLAAMAIESGCEWVTTDRDFSRFRGLRRRHPLRQAGRADLRGSRGSRVRTRGRRPGGPNFLARQPLAGGLDRRG